MHPEFDFVATDSVANIPDDMLATIDLFLASRLMLQAEPKIVQQGFDIIREHGAKIILDIDDYWHLGTGHSMYQHYRETGLPAIIKENIRLSDAITCSTSYLADKIRPLNPNVHVFANCPHDLYDQFKPEPTPSHKVRFGWFGAAQHTEDIELLRTSMGILAADRSLDDLYAIYLGGFAPTKIHMGYEEVFSANDKNPNYGRIMAADIYSYVQGYNLVDVCLAPLRNTLFNGFKSELKIVEAGWMGKAVIASDMQPYNDLIEHGVDGYLVQQNRERDWYKWIRHLARHPEIAKEMGARLQAKIRKQFNVEEITPRRAELYKSVGRHI